MTKRDEDGFDSASLYQALQDKLARARVPLPAKPRSEEPELSWPEDPEEMTIVSLGQKMLRLAGYYGWCQRLAGRVGSELALVEAELRLRVNAAGLKLRGEDGPLGKRTSAELVEAAVLEERPELRPLWTRKHELAALKVELEARLATYDKLYGALSREQSRRELESRVIGS